MKRLIRSLPVKITAVFLFVLFGLSTLSCLSGIVYADGKGYYESNTHSYYDTESCSSITYAYAQVVSREYFPLVQAMQDGRQDPASAVMISEYERIFSAENTNFFFQLTDSGGRELLSNCPAELSYQYRNVYRESTAENGAIREYTLTCYVKAPIEAKDDYYNSYLLFQLRHAIIGVFAATAVLLLLVFLFLMCAAGHRAGNDGIVLNGFDRIPLDLLLCGIAGLIFCIFAGGFHFLRGSVTMAIMLVLFTSAVLLLCLAACMTLSARLKAGKWWRNTICWRILNFLKGLLRSVYVWVRDLVRGFMVMWKAVLLFSAAALADLIFIFFGLSSGSVAAFFLHGILLFVALAVLLRCAAQLQDLTKGGSMIEAGNMEYQIDTSGMFWDFRRHGETLNHISSGLSKAVEAQLKSERFKAELITNVSHDIKTPLTSIINYIDLLKKEELPNETAQEYLRILERQSARLKKLTEDLVEASKASTGNIPVRLAYIHVTELLNQCMGEYEDRFRACGLQPVVTIPKTPVGIYADGRLLWRVFDNLLNNICKYAQPQTRVFFSVAADSGRVRITLKNISRDVLNITPEELMERFVRGDSARTSEGSGLGLSIARSLTELQHGTFALSIDGDLFKAEITFAEYPQAAEV